MLVKWPKYENILRLHEYNYQGRSDDFKLGWHFYIQNYKKHTHKVSHKINTNMFYKKITYINVVLV